MSRRAFFKKWHNATMEELLVEKNRILTDRKYFKPIHPASMSILPLTKYGKKLFDDICWLITAKIGEEKCKL